jgi:hypothetical protein
VKVAGKHTTILAQNRFRKTQQSAEKFITSARAIHNFFTTHLDN